MRCCSDEFCGFLDSISCFVAQGLLICSVADLPGGFCFSTVVMSSLSRELVFLILQFLDEEKFKESVHKYAIVSSNFELQFKFLFKVLLIFVVCLCV